MEDEEIEGNHPNKKSWFCTWFPDLSQFSDTETSDYLRDGSPEGTYNSTSMYDSCSFSLSWKKSWLFIWEIVHWWKGTTQTYQELHDKGSDLMSKPRDLLKWGCVEGR